MALQIHSPSTLTNKPYHHHDLLLHTPRLLSSTKPKLTIKSQNSTTNTEPTNDPALPKKPTSPGLGFGSSSSSPAASTKPGPPKSTSSSNKKKQKGKRERASIIRRSPVEKPAFINQADEGRAKEQSRNESAFLLAWLGLGGVILVEGVVLAASGFLPEEWDNFFVKYLYPSFTPTVFLFVAGTIAYGVLKYLQNENLKDQK